MGVGARIERYKFGQTESSAYSTHLAFENSHASPKYFPLAYHLENLKVMLSTVGEGMWDRSPGPPNHVCGKAVLTTPKKRCNMTLRDPKPPDFLPQETEN